MTACFDCTVPERTNWLAAGIDTAYAVRHHQAAGASKRQRRSGVEGASRCSVGSRLARRLASRLTPSVGASLKSP